jgi:hypothetical protein
MSFRRGFPVLKSSTTPARTGDRKSGEDECHRLEPGNTVYLSDALQQLSSLECSSNAGETKRSEADECDPDAQRPSDGERISFAIADDSANKTLLGLAACANASRFDEILSQARALLSGNIGVVLDVNVNVRKIQDRRTPLHRCAARGNAKLAEFLILHNADIDAQDANGATPLSDVRIRTRVRHRLPTCNQAASNGHLEVCDLLLFYNANVHLAKANGITPLRRAVSKGYSSIGILLSRCRFMQLVYSFA